MYTTPYKDWFNTRNEHRENIYFYAVSPKDIEPKRLLEADKRAESSTNFLYHIDRDSVAGLLV